MERLAKQLPVAVAAALVVVAFLAQDAAGKGIGATVAPQGVTQPGSPYRYVAIAPRSSHTVLARTDRRGGRISRWWTLPGRYMVPAVAYDGRAGGLSADGRTLVLTRLARIYPPRTAGLAIVNTQVNRRNLGIGESGVPSQRVIHRVSLPGSFNFQAISADGSTVYLTEHTERFVGGAFRLRALDSASGKLRREAIVDRARPHERAKGVPISIATSRDERWAYALYSLYKPRKGAGPRAQGVFLHALDTERGRLVRVDLPQLDGRSEPFELTLRRRREGRLSVYSRPPGEAGSRPLVTVDARDFRVEPPPAEATASEHGAASLLSRGALLAVSNALSALGNTDPSGFLDFVRTPRRPGNLVKRAGIAGHSAAGRPIRLRQYGDPALPGELLVFGCIHGDECAGRGIRPLVYGCPDPYSDIYVVPNLDPDGSAAGTRLNANGVDLNRNFPSGWRQIGAPGDPQYSGREPLSEPESRLAARIVTSVRPAATVWFHQHRGPRAFVRAWGQSAPVARLFAARAGVPFLLLPWPAGTAPNWQNHRFRGSSSFVVELPSGGLSRELERRLEAALVWLGRKVSRDENAL